MPTRLCQRPPSTTSVGMTSTMHRYLCFVTLAVLTNFTAFAQVSSVDPDANVQVFVSDTAQTPPARLIRSYAEFPLMFEANQGQLNDTRVKFLSHGPGYSVSLSPDAVALTLAAPATSLIASGARLLGALTKRPVARTSVTLQLSGANALAKMDPLEQQETKTNYFIGSDPARWHPGVRNFRRVRAHNVYPGIDLLFSGTQQQLEYDFVVAPNADPRTITLKINGAQKTFIEENGDLVLRTVRGDVLMRRPRIYQERDGETIGIEGGYHLSRGSEIGFRIGPYDRSRELVIDPILSYSLALGTGPSNDRFLDAALPFGITTDSSGNVYVSGTTCAANFPVTPGGAGAVDDGTDQACHDAFVTKIHPSGSSLLYSTVIGGSSRDGAARLALDSTGAAFITGLTQSDNFPTTANAYDRTFSGGMCFLTTCPDAFVAKLSPDGSQLVYSTYLGGSNIDLGVGIAVNTAGNAFVTGVTFSADFPTMGNVIQDTFGGDHDAVITALSADGSALLFSTYFGGNDGDTGMGIALDGSGNVYVAGGSGSSNFQVTVGSGTALVDDVFVMKISGSGDLQYSRLLGGANRDFATNVVVDSSGAAYLVGSTNSGDFPVTNGALQTSYGGGSTRCFALTIDCGDAFIAKLDRSAAVVWSTFLGGEYDDGALSIALDGTNSLWITGDTNSTGDADPRFPLTIDTYATSGTTLVSNISADGSQLLFSTLLNPGSEGIGTGITVDSAGNVYATGQAGVPATTAGVYSISSTDPVTGYVVKLVPGTARPAVQLSATALAFPPDFSGAQALGSTSPPQAVILTNTGNAPLFLSFEFTQAGSFAPPPSGFSETDDCGSVVAAGASCTIQVTFHPLSLSEFQASLLIHDNAPDGPHSIALFGLPGSPELLITPELADFGGQTPGTTSSTAFVELKDLSLVPFSVSGVSFTGANASDFTLVANTCATSSTRCFIGITFRPGSTGPRTATAIVTDSEPGSPHTIALTGEGTNGPIASLSPKSLGFGAQAVGVSATQSVNLTNRGTAVLRLSQVTASGDYSVDSTGCGSQLQPGNLCTLSVTFTPSSAGQRAGALTVADDAFDSPQIVTLDGYGIDAGPVLAFSTTVGGSPMPTPPVRFGNVAVGLSSTQGQVIIFNWGRSTLNVSGISISGDFSLPNLALEQPACASIVADVFNSCTLRVVFTPTAAGTRTGALTVTSNAPGSPHVLTLVGNGSSAGVVVMSPTILAFGNQGIGSTSASLPIMLTNAGSAPILIRNISVTGPFSATSQCGATVAIGASCTIAVSFAPAAAGTSTGTLTITDDAVGGSQTVGLTGNGITGPAVALRPSVLNFAGQPLATTSAAQTITLINSGTALLTINGIAATGDFSASTCPTTLSPGASCTINVAFTPSASGPRAGMLTISDNGLFSPQIASLSGTGTTATLTQTTTSVVSSLNPSSFGQSVTFTASVTTLSAATPTGTVTFMDGSTPIGAAPLNTAAQATLTTSSLALGTHSITAVYAGDSAFAGSTSTVLSQIVQPPSQATTVTTLGSSLNPSTYLRSVTFTATVTSTSPGTPGGMVSFLDGSNVIGTAMLDAGARASFTTALLTAGTHSITAVYGGDSNFAASKSVALTQTVQKAVTTTMLASSQNPSATNAVVAFTAVVSSTGNPTGIVTVLDRKKILGTAMLDSGGMATLSISLSTGSHSITAVYAGDANFAASTSPPIAQRVCKNLERCK
jgi:hypothetical protein